MKIYNKKNKRRFYTFPEFTVCNQKSASRDKVLIEKRRNVWLQLTKRNLNRFSGRLFVCSDHFVSGKPAYLYLTEDVDWVPTLNLGNLGQDKQSLTTYSGGSSTDNNGSLKTECVMQQGLINSSTSNDYSNFSGINQKDLSLSNQSESPSVIENGERPRIRKKPMVTIFNRQILFDDCPTENSSSGVQCVLDQSITVKEERIEVEDVFEAQELFDESTERPFTSISTAECATQVELDKPYCPLQLDKSTQTEMSSFPKPGKLKKWK